MHTYFYTYPPVLVRSQDTFEWGDHERRQHGHSTVHQVFLTSHHRRVAGQGMRDLPRAAEDNDNDDAADSSTADIA